MDVSWVYPHAVPDPDFISVTGMHLRLCLEYGNLCCDFAGQPQVVGVEKRQEFPLRCGGPAIACSTDATMGLRHV